MSYRRVAHSLGEREPSSSTPEPEVLPRAERRQFTAAYKLKILEEVERCTEHGQIGALLRREGLYSSHLSKWRMSRERGWLHARANRKAGRKPKDPMEAELERLRRENEQLRARLEKAELIIEVQKKVSQLLGLTPDETESDESE